MEDSPENDTFGYLLSYRVVRLNTYKTIPLIEAEANVLGKLCKERRLIRMSNGFADMSPKS